MSADQAGQRVRPRARDGAGSVVEGVCAQCEEDREFRRGGHVRHRNTGALGVLQENASNGSVLVLWDEKPTPERAMTRLLSRR